MGSMRRNIIAVKTRPGEVRFVAVASIERVEAFGNYVKIHFGNERVLHRATLSDMEEILDDRFRFSFNSFNHCGNNSLRRYYLWLWTPYKTTMGKNLGFNNVIFRSV